jgi:lysophospholipase L1-like esterase
MRSRLALVAVGLAVALLLAEGALRVADRVRCFDDTSGGFVEPHRLFGWAHTPGASGWAKRCRGTETEWATYVRINSRGLRDGEIPYERSDAYRILLLGDSFTQGLQVALDETFAKQMERRLNAARPAGPRIEVVNAGHGGFGTTNELLFYRYEGRKYRADLVLLVFNTENDAMENSRVLLRDIPTYYPPKPNFVFENGRLLLEDFPLPEPREPWRTLARARRALARHSALYRFLRSLSLPRLALAAPAPDPVLGPLGLLLKRYPPEWQEAWQLTRVLVRRLRREVERDGARFAVAVISGGHEVSERRLALRLYLARQGRARDRFDMDRSFRTVSRFLRRERIPYVALLERFRAHLRETGVDGYYQWDPHWNAAGHALAAEVIAEGLEDLGLVPVPAAGSAGSSQAQAPSTPGMRDNVATPTR